VDRPFKRYGRVFTRPDAPDWRFRVDELWDGTYRAQGGHGDGRLISRKGSDHDELVEQIVADAIGAPP
jgi:hypothetical protein